MDKEFPIVVSAGTIQTALLAALRMLAVLIGGFTAIVGFVAKRDLTGLIAYVQSSDFLAVAGALAALGSFAYGVWKTHHQKRENVAMARILPNDIATVVEGKPTSNTTLAMIPLLGLVLALGLLSGCATVGNDVRLNANRAFLTAQIAFKSTQQTVLAVCRVPTPSLVAPCDKAIALLRTGAQAEAAGFASQQAGNAAGLQAAILALTDLPPRLVALGVLEAN